MVVALNPPRRAAVADTLARVTDMHASVGDLVQQMASNRLYQEARSQGFLTLSDFLEHEDPSAAEDLSEGLDAYSRMLMVSNITPNSDARLGVRADTMEVWSRDNIARGLFPEYLRRQLDAHKTQRERAARAAQERAQTIYLSTDYAENSVWRPIQYEPDLIDQTDLQPQVPLSAVVRRSRGVDSDRVGVRYLSNITAASLRLRRVAEGAEIPRVTIMQGVRDIRLHKFGVGLEATYESLRRMPIDEFADHLRLIGIYIEVDRVAAAADVVLNGDGNANTSATSYDLTDLDPAATVDIPTIRSWIAFRNKFRNPFRPVIMLGNEDVITDILMIAVTTTTYITQLPANTGLGQGFRPLIGQVGDIAYAVLDSMPARKLLLFDSTQAVEHLIENGSEITETDRWVNKQVEALFLTVNENFRVWNPMASKVMVLDA